MTLNKEQKDAVRAALETIDGKLGYQGLAPARAERLRKAKAVLVDMLQAPAPQKTLVSQQVAREAIDGAILLGRMGQNRPPSADHWLMEYWLIGQQLAEFGKTGIDNINPPDDAPSTSTSEAIREPAP